MLFCIACNNPADEKTSTPPAASFTQKDNKAQLASAISLIQTGDMITRTGNDFTSNSLRQFCQTDKTYSHCGIASIEQDTVFVYHALGGEFNPDQALLREPLSLFVATEANKGFGIFRFNMDSVQTGRLINEARTAFANKITFDMKFDLATDDKMYCSEFTAKMFRRAFQNDSMFVPVKIPGLVYLAPDNLFTHAACKKVFAATY
ncbi:MAG: YiiX/YebB-like N1pC/P60 family cysteine hydrolase [Chitinophagaceae bacterium]